MKTFNWPSIGLYCLLGIFVFYQQLHAKNFRGASQGFGLLISVSAFMGSVTGLVFIGYYGWNISWLAAAGVFALGLFAGTAGLAIERFVGAAYISFVGLIGWPLCGYFMFKLLGGDA